MKTTAGQLSFIFAAPTGRPLLSSFDLLEAAERSLAAGSPRVAGRDHFLLHPTYERVRRSQRPQWGL